MIRNVDLIGFLPEFVAQYRELKHIMDGASELYQEAEDQTEVIKNNQFVRSCDVAGIRKFEELLGITPLEDDNLEARVSRVITRWNDAIPYTYRDLVAKLALVVGDGSCELYPDFASYALSVVMDLPLSGQVEEVDRLLGYMVPANIVVSSRNVMEREESLKSYVGGVMSTSIVRSVGGGW